MAAIKKLDINGRVIKNVALFKKKDPKALIFDSGLELRCYKKFTEAGLDFDFQPTARELLPPLECLTLSKGKTKRKVFTAKVRGAVYTMDFLIRTGNGITIFIEAKGFYRPIDRMRVKLFQHTLRQKEMVLLIMDKTFLRDIVGIIDVINDEYGGSGKSLQNKKNKIDTL